MDPRVKAIRNDVLVGEGTVSSVNYCYTHDELVERLDEGNISTPHRAVEWAREAEGLRLELALQRREDGQWHDLQTLMWKAWNEALDKYPIVS